MGTSTSGAYIESATGIREGARTGLAAVTTAGSSRSLFFIPLVEPLQHLRYAYGPALVAVGVLMMRLRRKIDFDDLTELVPGLRDDRDDGLHLQHRQRADGRAGALPVVKLAAGRAREVTGGGALGALCLVLCLRAAALSALQPCLDPDAC